MNKYLKIAIHVTTGVIKVGLLKIFHPIGFHGSLYCAMSPLTEITLERKGHLYFERKFRMRDGAKIRVRNGAVCKIGKNAMINTNNIITCRDSIIIGENVMLSPGVQIYDHDHKFGDNGSILNGEYNTAPITIGNNVWIGANTIILRGTTIGNNCVIGAGCIVKGNIKDSTVFYQKRIDSKKVIDED